MPIFIKSSNGLYKILNLDKSVKRYLFEENGIKVHIVLKGFILNYIKN